MSVKATQWTREQARDIVRELEASGLKVADFARLNNIKPKRLYRWRRLLQSDVDDRSESAPRLVELVAKKQAVSASIQIHCRDGHTIAFNADELLVGLQAALTAIKQVSPC